MSNQWPSAITAITLFVDDLEATKAFYIEVFGLDVHYQDDVSAVFNFGNTLVNVLHSSAAVELVEPAAPGASDSGPRVLLTITVDDVDATCQLLTDRGVSLLNGPMDRPWGIRTASFADPGGHVWEIAH